MAEFATGHIGIFEYAVATLEQAAPVQNTFYTILDTTPNCRVYSCTVLVEDANEDLEVRIIINGITIDAVSALACTHSTRYYCYMFPEPTTTQVMNTYLTASELITQSMLIEGKSVKVQVRKTSVTGAGDLTGVIAYGVLKHV